MSYKTSNECLSCKEEPGYGLFGGYGENCIEQILQPKSSRILQIYNRFRKRL